MRTSVVMDRERERDLDVRRERGRETMVPFADKMDEEELLLEKVGQDGEKEKKLPFFQEGEENVFSTPICSKLFTLLS